MALARRSQTDLGRRGVFLLIVGIVLLIPALVWPTRMGQLQMQALKPQLIEAVAIGLLLLMMSRASWSPASVRRFLRTGPNVPILLFAGWCALTYFDSCDKAFGLRELLRIGGGMVVYFAVVYRLSARRQLQKLVGGLIAAVIASVLLGSILVSERPGGGLGAAFGNPQLFASFLLICLPLVLVASQGDEHPWRRAAGQFALVLAVGALLLTQNRSSWLGTLVGLGLLAVLAVRRSAGSRALLRQKHQILVPALVILSAVGFFFVFSGSVDSFLARARTLGHVGADSSWRWRTDMWAAAWTMFKGKPLTGWGIGSFPLFASYLAAPAMPILEGRMPSLSQMAHNQYLQVLAETGLIGLSLYLSILAGFFARCWRAMKENTSQTRQWLLIGTMAAIAAQMVDAFGNPGWQFSEVGLFFWLVLGIGVAASRPRPEREAEEALEALETQRAPVVRRPSWGTRAGWVMAQAAVLGMAVLLVGQAYAQPAGKSGVVAQQLIPEYQGCQNPVVTPSSVTSCVPTAGGTLQCFTFTFTVDIVNTSTGTVDTPGVDVTNSGQTTVVASPGLQMGADQGQWCVTSAAPTNSALTITFTFNPTGTVNPTGPCIATATILTTGTCGGGGGGAGGGGGSTAGIIIGAIAGAGLLALLLLRHKKGGGGGGGDGDGGEEKGGSTPGGGATGGGTPISEKVKVPPGAVTAIRTEPEELVVRNSEPRELKVFVQLDDKPLWYEVTDHPALKMEFHGGTARLVAQGTTSDRYLVERDGLAKGGLKVMVSFRDKTCETPVSFYAP